MAHYSDPNLYQYKKIYIYQNIKNKKTRVAEFEEIWTRQTLENISCACIFAYFFSILTSTNINIKKS